MPEDIITEIDAAPDTAAAGEPCPAEKEAAETEAPAARWPDVSAYLPGGSIWLYAIPVILLLVLWLFYPVVLILICMILLLWWLA